MSVLKNNVYSSSSDIPAEAGYASVTYSDNGYLKNDSGTHNNNNNLQRYEYISISGNRKFKVNKENAYVFWTLVAMLIILTLANLLLNLVILNTLRLGYGMESLELVPDESLVKFHGNADLDQVYKQDGRIEGFGDVPMVMTGDRNSVKFRILEGPERSLELGMNRTIVRNVQAFEVKHPVTGKSVFSTGFPNFGLPRGVVKLDVKRALTRKVTAPLDQTLLIKSESFTILKGSEGAHMDGKEITWAADQDIFLKSVNRSIVLNGADGVSLSDVRSLPVSFGVRQGRSQAQYKLCVCMPEGRVFRVTVPPGQTSQSSCHTVDVLTNPCI